MVFEVFEKRLVLGLNGNDFLITTVNFDPVRKIITAFSIVQLYGEKEIIKYDTAHGKVHVHKYYVKRNVVSVLFNEEICVLTFARLRSELLLNWENYKELYLKKERFNNL
jgi:hypothetical protein